MNNQKNIYVLLTFIFITVNAFAFSQEPAIKIYLEDGFSHKHVKNAKVTLEGFELTQIIGKYNKRGHYYYFDTIPNGYNTVMAYHKNYNEKGLQKIKGLPRDVNLILYNEKFVSYEFDKPKLEEIKNYLELSEYLKNLQIEISEKGYAYKDNFKYYYNEDPYHIAILSEKNMKTFFSDYGIQDLLNELSLEQTNYIFENQKSDCYGFGFDGFQRGFYYLNNVEGKCLRSNIESYNVYFFHKKDNTPFNRYNSKELQKLREKGLIFATLTNRIIEYYADVPSNEKILNQFYNNQIIKFNEIYHSSIKNYRFGLLKEPVKVFFTSTELENYYYFGKKNGGSRVFPPASNSEIINSVYFVMPKSLDLSIGLGALDQNNTEEIYFFNVY